MKKLIIGLMLVMAACKQTAEVKKEAFLPDSPSNESDPYASIDMDAILTNLNAALNVPRRDLSTQPSYLPNGAYSAFGEVLDCVNNDMLFPGDFEVYADNNATFWDSIPESVVFGYQNDGVLRDNSISMLSTTTGHQGSSFKYEHLGQNKWLITFNASCTRVYHCHIGDCLE